MRSSARRQSAWQRRPRNDSRKRMSTSSSVFTTKIGASGSSRNEIGRWRKHLMICDQHSQKTWTNSRKTFPNGRKNNRRNMDQIQASTQTKLKIGLMSKWRTLRIGQIKRGLTHFSLNSKIQATLILTKSTTKTLWRNFSWLQVLYSCSDYWLVLQVGHARWTLDLSRNTWCNNRTSMRCPAISEWNQMANTWESHPSLQTATFLKINKEASTSSLTHLSSSISSFHPTLCHKEHRSNSSICKGTQGSNLCRDNHRCSSNRRSNNSCHTNLASLPKGAGSQSQDR